MHTIASNPQDDPREAFGTLLQQHRGIVFKVANSYAWQADDRDDLAQEIATQLWHAWPRYDPARSFSTWMYRVALNVAISHVREHSMRLRHDAVPLDADLHEMTGTDTSDHEHRHHLLLLQRFIQQQAPLDRALLLLYLDERPQREIADILGISESNVSTKIGRLKQRIQQTL